VGSLLFLFVGTSLLLTLLAIPMVAGKIPPNPWYGFRTRASLEDPELWYKVNRYSGRWLLVIGVLGAVVALALYPLCAPGGETYATLYALIILPLLTLSVLDSLRYQRSLQ
jgi:uncharacterized membrane protein